MTNGAQHSISTVGNPPTGDGQSGYHLYVTILGANQGYFKSDLTGTHRIPAIGYSLEGSAPRDPSTLQQTGRRTYQPVVITKALGPSTVQCLSAFASNEVIASVFIEFIKTVGLEEKVYCTVKLSDGTICDIRHMAGIAHPDHPLWPSEAEAVSFTFRKIELHHVASETSSVDEPIF